MLEGSGQWQKIDPSSFDLNCSACLKSLESHKLLPQMSQQITEIMSTPMDLLLMAVQEASREIAIQDGLSIIYSRSSKTFLVLHQDQSTLNEFEKRITERWTAKKMSLSSVSSDVESQSKTLAEEVWLELVNEAKDEGVSQGFSGVAAYIALTEHHEKVGLAMLRTINPSSLAKRIYLSLFEDTSSSLEVSQSVEQR